MIFQMVILQHLKEVMGMLVASNGICPSGWMPGKMENLACWSRIQSELLWHN
jgi:hypothetical protein